MTPHRRISLADVRQSLDPNVVSDPPVRWFGRPIGNLVTPAFHNSGWTANQVTGLRAVIAAVGVAVLAVPDPRWWPIAGVAYFVGYVLDCVDGNLARLQERVSYFGKFLDGVADGVHPIGAAFAAGIGSGLYFEQPSLIVLGGTIAIASASMQMLRARLSFSREWMVGQSGKLTEEETAAAAGAYAAERVAAIVLINGYFLANIALLVPVWGGVAFLFVAVPFQLLPDLLWMGAIVVAARAILRRPRRSKHSRSPAPVTSNQ